MKDEVENYFPLEVIDMIVDTEFEKGYPRASGMPMLGLGTAKWTDPAHCARNVCRALEMGYRHVDTARFYDNEQAVGTGIAEADVPRDEIFLATKIWHHDLGFDDVIECTNDSLNNLGTDYVDILYIHWPYAEYDPDETLAAFQKLYKDGKIGAIGASNFRIDHLDRAAEALDIPIFSNQVEVHPLLQQDEMCQYCDNNDIEVVAYSPLAKGKIFDMGEITDIAEQRGISGAQVTLAWLRQKGVTAIPRGTGEQHQRENIKSISIELNQHEVDKIESIDRTERIENPPFVSW